MTESSENHVSEIPVEAYGQDQEIETTEAEAKPSSNREGWILFIIAGIVILLDQASKNLVESMLPLYTYYAPIPELENILRITHTSNTGVAFGLFQNGNTIFAIFAVIVTIAIIIYNSRLEAGHKLLRLALGLQVGGAIGNLVDRIRQGYVTDFVDIGPWPVWNVADLAIVSGTILLVLIMFHEERQEKRLAAEKSVGADQAKPQTEPAAQEINESSTS